MLDKIRIYLCDRLLKMHGVDIQNSNQLSTQEKDLGLYFGQLPQRLHHYDGTPPLNEYNKMPGQTVIDHVVLLKVKEDATEEDIERMKQGVLALKVIPGVLTITVGHTFAEEWMPDRRNGLYIHEMHLRYESTYIQTF